MQISIDKLSFKYNKNHPLVLDNIAYQINEGSITVLLGLNGCGKTTLIKLLAGLLKPSNGSIKYGEEELNSLSIAKRSKIFSYVPQKTYVADDYLVYDYLSYGFVNSLNFYQTPTKEQEDKILKLAEELDITKLLDKKMGNISGGERQIVTIASCVLQNTPIILLDEPTSALDLKNQNLVLSLIKKLSEEGKTIIFSSHNPNHALSLNSNVVLLDKGHIVSSGYANKVCTKEILTEIYGDNICYSNEVENKEITFKNL